MLNSRSKRRRRKNNSLETATLKRGYNYYKTKILKSIIKRLKTIRTREYGIYLTRLTRF